VGGNSQLDRGPPKALPNPWGTIITQTGGLDFKQSTANSRDIAGLLNVGRQFKGGKCGTMTPAVEVSIWGITNSGGRIKGLIALFSFQDVIEKINYLSGYTEG